MIKNFIAAILITLLALSCMDDYPLNRDSETSSPGDSTAGIAELPSTGKIKGTVINSFGSGLDSAGFADETHLVLAGWPVTLGSAYPAKVQDGEEETVTFDTTYIGTGVSSEGDSLFDEIKIDTITRKYEGDILNPDSSRIAVTALDGSFEFDSLQPGQYVLYASGPGEERSSLMSQSVTVEAGKVAQVSFDMAEAVTGNAVLWQGEVVLTSDLTIGPGRTYVATPGTQLLLTGKSTLYVEGTLVISGKAGDPVRILNPAGGSLAVSGEIHASHFVANGAGGTLIQGHGGVCVLKDAEITGYAAAVQGAFDQMDVRDAVFNGNDVSISLSRVGGISEAVTRLEQFSLVNVHITGSGQQVDRGVEIGGAIKSGTDLLLQHLLFDNLDKAVSYAVPTLKVKLTGVNLTVKNCNTALSEGVSATASSEASSSRSNRTGGSSGNTGGSGSTADTRGFGTVIISNADISTTETAIKIDSAYGTESFILENANVRTEKDPPVSVQKKANTEMQFENVALIGASGIAFNTTDVYKNVGDSASFKQLDLDSLAQPGRGAGYAYIAVSPVEETAGTDALTVPAVPMIDEATGQDGAVKITWIASTGATAYNLYYAAGKTVSRTGAKLSGVSSPKTVTGLANGTEYTFAVSAVNALGESELSSPITVKPLVKPDAPVITATAGDGSVSVSWEAVSQADSYTLYYSKGASVNAQAAKFTEVTSPKAVSGLANGTAYTFAVTAVNAVGESGLSSVVTVTPGTEPAAPANVSVEAGNSAVTVTWDAVPGAGSYTLYYAAGATVDANGAAFPKTSTPKTVSGLSNGTLYAFAVSSTNAFGESALSAISTAIPLAAPGPPVITGAAPGDSSVTLSWSQVALATSYNVYYAAGTSVNKNGLKLTGTIPPLQVGGLANGTTYAFAVSAANPDGESALSAVKTATPGLPPPSAPTGVAAEKGAGFINVSWNAVSGATSYNVYYAAGSTVETGDTRIEDATSPKRVTGLTGGTTYAFGVTAVNTGGESALSAVATAVPDSAGGGRGGGD